MGVQNALGEEKISKLLLKFSIPAIVGMLVNALYNIIDRMFIGHIPKVGNLAITGIGVTMPISTIILGFGMLVGVGTAATISIRLGQNKKDEAEKILGNAFTLIIIISLIITAIGLIWGKNILTLFGASDSTLVYAQDYMQIIFVGTIFNMLSFGLNHTIRASGSPNIAMASMLIGAITNIVLDPIFIFWLGLGVKGGAIATVIAQIASAIWGISFFLRGNANLRVKAKNFKLKKEFVLAIFAIGMSPFAMQVAASVVQVISNNALKAYGGDLAIGAMTIISSVNTFICMPIFGLNQGVQPIVGYNYGAKKYDRVREAIKYPQIFATIIAATGFLLIMFVPDVLVKFFNTDPALLEITEHGMRIFLFMIPLVASQIIRTNYFSCIGKAKKSMVLSLLRQVILLIPCLLILPRIPLPSGEVLGLTGVWLAGPVSDFLSVIITHIIFTAEMKTLGAENIEVKAEAETCA
ncbi:MAG: MATE family efflux transporter [Clostridium sp.]|uniref:MATE family efflux transporter n=1 Tax=Clostridium culturomicium TaxID=1499683 RepID=UPI00290ABE3B|nr:MATE family efflux transporter [Clostridium sp.]MDU7082849.1 MATE family efflux transporter [Clostridium sp.]